MTAHLRRADARDLDAIMAIEEAVFEGDAWSRDSMERELAGEHGWYLVAVEGDAVLGYAGLLAPRGSGQADVQTIAVVPEARRGGLGRALMLALIGEARERRALEVFLEVRADNPGAQTLYEELGFERIAVRPRYYQGVVDAIIMRLEVPAPRTLPAMGQPA